MQDVLIRQDACAAARKRFFDTLVQFEPCREMKLGDLIWIADWVSSVTFDAIKQVDEKEDR